VREIGSLVREILNVVREKTNLVREKDSFNVRKIECSAKILCVYLELYA
jgi:hypothetical protein